MGEDMETEEERKRKNQYRSRLNNKVRKTLHMMNANLESECEIDRIKKAKRPNIEMILDRYVDSSLL